MWGRIGIGQCGDAPQLLGDHFAISDITLAGQEEIQKTNLLVPARLINAEELQIILNAGLADAPVYEDGSLDGDQFRSVANPQTRTMSPAS